MFSFKERTVPPAPISSGNASAGRSLDAGDRVEYSAGCAADTLADRGQSARTNQSAIPAGRRSKGGQS